MSAFDPKRTSGATETKISSDAALSMPRKANPDGVCRWDWLRPRVGPGGGLGKLLPRHVECGDLPAEYADRLDRNRDRPAPPPEPRTIRDDQQNLAGRSTHHLPHVAERRLIVVIDRQADQIADFDGLRKPPRHPLLGRL